MTAETNIERFMENAGKVGAECHHVRSEAEFGSVVERILNRAAFIYCPGITERERGLLIPPGRRTDDYRVADTCIQEVDGAIAESGSIINTSRVGRAVQGGLLPSHHVAMVSAENIHATLDDFFAGCGDSPPTNITLETGPSRTADIELTLTIGVHGPEKLTIIVLSL